MSLREVKHIVILLFVMLSWCAHANENEQRVDTLIAMDKVQITAVKQGVNLRREAVAASVLSGRTLEMRGVSAVKDVMTDVPNLFMPD